MTQLEKVCAIFKFEFSHFFRSGKEFPDSFNRVVPIWCAVINHLTVKLKPELLKNRSEIPIFFFKIFDKNFRNWQKSIQNPKFPSWIPKSEIDQICSKIPTWKIFANKNILFFSF